MHSCFSFQRAPWNTTMAYRLKSIRYKDQADCRILLQNENGPCPLLAAANALLLRGTIHLPAHCVRNGVASLEDLTNMLANQAMQLETDSHYVEELLHHIPKFQYGMDVNPKFTQGITGYECTSQLTAFDMLHVQLVHGWLVDPQEDETYEAIGSKTYNELVELVIHGHEAHTAMSEIHKEMDALKAMRPQELDQSWDLLDDAPSQAKEKLSELQAKYEEQSKVAKQGSLINNFLESTGHQLTIYGLHVLYEQIKEDELCAFFRNNHYNTLTKHEGVLYILVTDYGYANTPGIVWEKLDVIDGDTEYVNSQFKRPATQAQFAPGPSLTAEQMLSQSSQNDADYHLALHLSMETSNPNSEAKEGDLEAAATEANLKAYHGKEDSDLKAIKEGEEKVEVGVPVDPPSGAADGPGVAPPEQGTQEDADRLLAMQLQAHHQSAEDASLALARRLQNEENQRAAAAATRTPRSPQRSASTTSSVASSSNCTIS